MSMYIPKYYKVTDVEEIWDFVQKNSFATVVTVNQDKPIATHLPMQFIKEGDSYYLTGHMAIGNPQWRTFETCEEVLVMFQGPHAYISSSWYEKENVPTWNYQSVHMYGSPSILEDEEMEHDLTKLLKKYEKHRENPVLWDKLTPELLKKQVKGIKGFKIAVKEIQAAYKLSQNRTEEDYYNIVKNLYKESDSNSQQMAQLMEHKQRKKE
jgi:transcriptional regulator